MSVLCKKWLVGLRDQAVVWWRDGLFAAVRGELSPFLPFVNITSDQPGESGGRDNRFSQSRRRPLLGPSPVVESTELLLLSHLSKTLY